MHGGNKTIFEQEGRHKKWYHKINALLITVHAETTQKTGQEHKRDERNWWESVGKAAPLNVAQTVTTYCVI